jgi:hypothetical protein
MPCTAYENGSNSPISFGGTLPGSVCYTTPQQLFLDFRNNLVATLPGNYAGLVVGDATPATSDQGKLWYRTTATCVPMGIFVFYNGTWVRAIPHHMPPGTIVPYYSSSFTSDHAANRRIVTYLDVYEQTYSAGADATNPFWRVCDGTSGTIDLRARVIVAGGDGTSASLQNRIQSSIGGKETVTLQATDIPSLTISSATAAGSGAAQPGSSGSITGSINVNNTGNGAHENMPPFYVLYYIMRTSRTV